MKKGYSSRKFQSDYRSQQAYGHPAIEFSREDLADVPTPHRKRWRRGAGKAVIFAFGACAIAMTLVAFNIGSKPTLSAADIILMDGYAGRQPVPPLITPASLSYESPTATRVDIREISARTSPTGAQTIAPQIIDLHFRGSPPPAVSDPETRMRVMQQWSNLRSTPNLGGKIVDSLTKHDVVTVVGQTDDWMQVKTRDNQVGYMHSSLLGEY